MKECQDMMSHERPLDRPGRPTNPEKMIEFMDRQIEQAKRQASEAQTELEIAEDLIRDYEQIKQLHQNRGKWVKVYQAGFVLFYGTLQYLENDPDGDWLVMSIVIFDHTKPLKRLNHLTFNDLMVKNVYANTDETPAEISIHLI